MDKDTEKDGKITGKDPVTGQFLPGNKLGGKTVGQRDFATDFDEAVDEIAKDNGITRSEARKILFKVAYKNAKDGNFSFYKDIHDRIYGTATQNVKVDANINEENKVELTKEDITEFKKWRKQKTSQKKK